MLLTDRHLIQDMDYTFATITGWARREMSNWGENFGDTRNTNGAIDLLVRVLNLREHDAVDIVNIYLTMLGMAHHNGTMCAYLTWGYDDKGNSASWDKVYHAKGLDKRFGNFKLPYGVIDTVRNNGVLESYGVEQVAGVVSAYRHFQYLIRSLWRKCNEGTKVNSTYTRKEVSNTRVRENNNRLTKLPAIDPSFYNSEYAILSEDDGIAVIAYNTYRQYREKGARFVSSHEFNAWYTARQERRRIQQAEEQAKKLEAYKAQLKADQETMTKLYGKGAPKVKDIVPFTSWEQVMYALNGKPMVLIAPNTVMKVETSDTVTVYLHGNAIIQFVKVSGALWYKVAHAGHYTKTTFSRIAQLTGVKVVQKNGMYTCNGWNVWEHFCYWHHYAASWA